MGLVRQPLDFQNKFTHWVNNGGLATYIIELHSFIDEEFWKKLFHTRNKNKILWGARKKNFNGWNAI